jgi:predicted MPP superfamily phosphohydrolase
VNRTKQLNPDMVFIIGDYLDGKIELKDETFAPLRQLNVPTFFVGGNHDEHTDLEAIKEKMRAAGVKVMENEVVEIENVQVVGLDYMKADDQAFDMHPSTGKQTIKKVLPGLKMNQEKPAILLHHSPVGVKYAKEQGIDLYLAGHVHAGQLFPITIISKLFFPYNSGLYEYEGLKIFVSQGAGTFGAPMRVGTKGEITLIALKPEVL